MLLPVHLEAFQRAITRLLNPSWLFGWSAHLDGVRRELSHPFEAWHPFIGQLVTAEDVSV